MRYALLVLLLALALPGCSMLGGNGDAGPTETVTPVPVTDPEGVDRGVTTETATPTPDRPDRPDGGEFADLLDDHERRIANTSYAYRRTISGTADGGDTVLDSTIEGYHGRSPGVYYRNRTRDGRRDRFWSNGTVYATARQSGDGIEYDARRASGSRGEARDRVNRLRRLFQYARPTEISENDTHYRIEGVFVRRDGGTILGPDATVENSSLSMTVTDAGLIESYRLDIHGERETGDRIDIVEEFYLDQSVDALPRPEWVDRAIDRARAEEFGNRIEGFGYAAEHEAALENTTYAYRVVTETNNSDVARGIYNETIRGYGGREYSVLLFERTYRDGENGVWSNGTITASRTVNGESTTYHVDRESSPFGGQDTDRLRQRLEFAERTDRRTNGTHELIEATLVSEDGTSAFGPDVTVENSTLSLVVTEDGVVEAYDLEATVVNEDGDRATVTERFRVDRSVDTFPRPDWVDRAIENETAD